MRENWKPDRGGRERLGRALHRAPFAHPATVRGRVCGRIGPLVHWYLCVVAVRAGGRARTWPVRSGRARESRGPVRFTRARGASPDSAAAAQGHFCHTLSVRRWPGASPQRGDRLVVRPAAPASRKHPVVIGAGCAPGSAAGRAPCRVSAHCPRGTVADAAGVGFREPFTRNHFFPGTIIYREQTDV